jgi:hypothetical protein
MNKKDVKLPGQDRFARIRQSFVKKVRERFFLRFHMLLILVATILSGLLSSKALLLVHIDNIVIRYPLAVIFSYAAFFLFVKLWLYYIAVSDASRREATANVLSNLPDPSSIGVSPSDTPLFSGGGGTSGGGGVSAAFDGPVRVSQQAMNVAAPASDSSSGIADAAGSAVSGIFDDDGIVLVAIGLLLAVIFGSSLYLIYDAPRILSDAAFNFLLASSLIRGYRTITKPDWIGSVLKSTCVPFIIVLAVSFGAAWIIHSRYPRLTKISDLLVPVLKSFFNQHPW